MNVHPPVRRKRETRDGFSSVRRRMSSVISLSFGDFLALLSAGALSLWTLWFMWTWIYAKGAYGLYGKRDKIHTRPYDEKVFSSIKTYKVDMVRDKSSVQSTDSDESSAEALQAIYKPPAAFPSGTNASNSKSVAIYLSVVIPAFNEAKRLPASLPAAIAYLNERGRLQSDTFRYEIIIVDDGSEDNTEEVALRLGGYVNTDLGRLRVIRLCSNAGKGLATRVGVRCAEGAFILMADADGATLFSDIERLEGALFRAISSNTTFSTTDAAKALATVPLPTAMTTPFHIAIGSRQSVGTADVSAQRLWIRNLMMHAFHFFVVAVVGNDIKDTQCGFKLFSREAARNLFLSLHIHRWAFDVELIVLAFRYGYRILEVPVNWKEIPGSKLEPFKAAIQMTKDLLRIKLLYMLGVWKCQSEVEAMKQPIGIQY